MRLIDADKLLLSAYWHGESWAQDKPYAANGVDAVDVCDIEAAPTIEIINEKYLDKILKGGIEIESVRED